jgi:hypothetical protein
MVTTATMLGQSSSLSPFAGPYVGEMLGRGAALASMPYQAYTGALTAGPSELQAKAYEGIGSLVMPSTLTGAGMGYGGSSGFPAVPTYRGFGAKPGDSLQDLPLEIQQIGERSRPASQPGGLAMVAEPLGPDDRPLQEGRPVTQEELERFRTISQSGGLGTIAGMTQQQPTQPMQQGAPTTQEQIASLMNPYIEQALNPQLEAAQRQADIAAQNLQSQYGRAGAYGGSRQGIAEAELQRGLLDRMAGLTGQGYQQAYDKAVDLLGKERGYGLDVLGTQRQAGAEQRGIEQEGIAADIAQFREERDDPFKKLQFRQSLLQGLPISTQTYQYAEPSGFSQFMGGAGGILGLLDTMGLFGNKKEGDR